jgi:hypothetical protein
MRPPAHVSVQVVLFGDRHWPASQTSPAAHARPHAPQFAMSVSTSEHMPLQNCQPLGHEHASGSPHAPLQSIWPGAHAHAPATHEELAGHATPQAPQWLGLVLVSMQNPPQFCCPSGHGWPGITALPEPAVPVAGNPTMKGVPDRGFSMSAVQAARRPRTRTRAIHAPQTRNVGTVGMDPTCEDKRRTAQFFRSADRRSPSCVERRPRTLRVPQVSAQK